MASFESIHGDPIGVIKHDLRERNTFMNEDIDPARSSENYVLSSHGSDSRTCERYYKDITSNLYIRGGRTITTAECVVTAPTDLDFEQKRLFFESSTEFLTEHLFAGDNSRCILATVHCDEAGQQHLHYMFTFPDVENPKYVDFQKKFSSGICAAEERLGRTILSAEKGEIESALHRYEMRNDKHREKDAIHDISNILDIKRDEARWVFTRCRRLESEKYERRMMAKDEFLPKEFFDNFHPEFQKWIDAHGFNCTVYKGGSGINLTVDQLKEMTRDTGYRLVEEKELTRLREKALEFDQKKSKEEERSWGSPGWEKERKW